MYSRILVPVDVAGDEISVKCLKVAGDLAKRYGAVLTALTVVPDLGYSVVAQYFPPDTEDRIADDAARQLAAFVAEHVPEDVACEEQVAQGSVYHEILRVAEESEADLIVIGAHRPDLRDYLLGPNAARVVRHAGASVFVVRG